MGVPFISRTGPDLHFDRRATFETDEDDPEWKRDDRTPYDDSKDSPNRDRRNRGREGSSSTLQLLNAI